MSIEVRHIVNRNNDEKNKQAIQNTGKTKQTTAY